MTTEIRKSIKKILSTQRAQHDRIKDVLVMICDEIDEIKNFSYVLDAKGIDVTDADLRPGKLVGVTDKLSRLQSKIKGDKKDGNE